MLNYIIRRFVIACVAIFVLATVTFFLMRLVPGDPFAGPRVAPEIRAALRAYYGLDKPLLEQYVIYMVNLLRGDLGLSLAMRGHTVTDIIATAFPVSLDLGIRAMILSIVFGIGFGVVAALNRGTALRLSDGGPGFDRDLGAELRAGGPSAILPRRLSPHSADRSLRDLFAHHHAVNRPEPGHNGHHRTLHALEHA